MEEYLQYMRTLRSHMNDVEDQAAKISVEEQMYLTTIQSLEKDVNAVKSETRQLKEDADLMSKTNAQLCSQILERLSKIGSLESDSSTLNQTLKLTQQERTSLSSKILEKSSYYQMVLEDIDAKLQIHLEWLNFYRAGGQMEERGQKNEAEKNLLAKVKIAEARLSEITEMKSKLFAGNSEIKQSIAEVKCRENEFKLELRISDIKTMEEEYNALVLDIAGESEFLRSLQFQTEQLKGISSKIKCSCGEEYQVAADISKGV